MAILAGNIGFKISSPLQFRVLLIPWFGKNNAISCAKGRDYSSSVPVRYVPKKNLKINESEIFLPIKGLERNELRKSSDASELRIEVTNSGRGVKRSVTPDRKFQNQNRMTKSSLLLKDAKQEFGEEINCEHGVIEESDEVFEEPWEVVEEMKIPQEKDIHYQNMLQAGRAMQDAENFAIKLLATRAFTAVEMRKKLNGKKFPPHVIEAVITNFQSRGLINDSLYAESFSRSRWSSASWGPRRIKQALFNKGISGNDADNAIKVVFRDGECDEDQESKLGMSKLSMDQLFIQASKQWLRSQDAPKDTRKLRIIRWLQYRGFNWGVTSFILKKLESLYPP
ncbi:Regulatory protein RecX [Melia azedarach]|uniref:Regulatory protein RecX n=1 Tax=Melia azedarach TaxID=155640 RepID=A0ACC1YPM4_MELAZ|nr:Regulatory protein RecX [Melia azedarach]